MKPRVPALAALLLTCPVIAATMAAQEGHPLTGTWYGEWGPEDDRRQVTLVMSFDGADVTGIMDPGPTAASVRARLDSTEWTVRIEAERRDGTAAYVAEGVVTDVGSRNRTISGTWQAGDAVSSFSIRRED